MPGLLVSGLRGELKPDDISAPVDVFCRHLPNLASLRVAGGRFAMQVLAGDAGNKLFQAIIPLRYRSDHDLAFSDANFDRMAFMHFDLIGKSFRNAQRETVTPFLQNCLHKVDTLAILDARRKIKSPCPRREGAATRCGSAAHRLSVCPMNVQELPFARRALALLAQGPFRTYIIGSAISDTGTWMQVMAQGWVLSSLTNQALVLGLVSFAAGIPTLAFTMIGGSAADRYDKRMILIATQVVQIATSLTLGILVWTGTIQIWHVVVLAAILGICIAFEMPAINALVPELVKKEEIATAIALDRSVFHGSRLVGPSLAGLFVAWWGAASAFFCNAVSFVALIISMVLLPPRAKGSAEEEEQRRSGFKEGLRYVRSDRTILSMIMLIALTTIFVFPVISVMLPLYVRNVLLLGPDSMGWLMAISGSGSVLGSLGLLSVVPKLRFKFMTGAALVVAVALFLLSRSNSFLLTACCLGTLAIGLSLNFGLAGTIVQERSPGPLRGRVSAIFGLSFFGLMPLAGLIITGLSDLIGMRTALAVAAGLFGVGSFLVMSAAGRTVCECPEKPVPEADAAPAPATVV